MTMRPLLEDPRYLPPPRRVREPLWAATMARLQADLKAADAAWFADPPLLTRFGWVMAYVPVDLAPHPSMVAMVLMWNTKLGLAPIERRYLLRHPHPLPDCDGIDADRVGTVCWVIALRQADADQAVALAKQGVREVRVPPTPPHDHHGPMYRIVGFSDWRPLPGEPGWEPFDDEAHDA